jgi:hypothetical protein
MAANFPGLRGFFTSSDFSGSLGQTELALGCGCAPLRLTVDRAAPLHVWFALIRSDKSWSVTCSIWLILFSIRWSAPVAANAKRRAWQRFAIVIPVSSATNGDAVLRESLFHSNPQNRPVLQCSPHDGRECRQSPSVEARDAPLAVNSRLQNLRRRCGRREWESMQIHRELDSRRSFFPQPFSSSASSCSRLMNTAMRRTPRRAR